MRLTIVAPHGMLCHTTVEEVSLPGEGGVFSVSQGNAPFMARLAEGEIVYSTGQGEHRQKIKGGIVKVSEDTVEVWIDPSDEQPRQRPEYVPD